MSRKLEKILTLIEIFGVVGFLIADHFTKSKMGMMRHVMYRNQVYSEGIFNSMNIKIIAVFLALVFTVNTFIFIKERSLRQIIPFAAFLYVLIMNADKMMSYYYGVMASVLILICEVIILTIKLSGRRRTSKFDK